MSAVWAVQSSGISAQFWNSWRYFLNINRFQCFDKQWQLDWLVFRHKIVEQDIQVLRNVPLLSQSLKLSQMSYDFLASCFLVFCCYGAQVLCLVRRLLGFWTANEKRIVVVCDFPTNVRFENWWFEFDLPGPRCGMKPGQFSRNFCDDALWREKSAWQVTYNDQNYCETNCSKGRAWFNLLLWLLQVEQFYCGMKKTQFWTGGWLKFKLCPFPCLVGNFSLLNKENKIGKVMPVKTKKNQWIFVFYVPTITAPRFP